MKPMHAGLCALFLVAGHAAMATPLVSDGSDGVFHPLGSLTLDLPEDGIFNFTTIDIPSGVTLRFRGNAAGTPAFMLATGAVSIAGVIDVSAGGVNLADLSNPALGYIRPATTSIGGPGGGAGGGAGYGDTTCIGVGCRDAVTGSGPSPGLAGPTPTHDGLKVYGVAGGGGGLATDGQAAQLYTLGAAGGQRVTYPPTLTGGSGGGGGSGWYFFGVQLGGGAGGGGGGALQISTSDTITVAGDLLALGANGGWSFANVGGQGGPGGGGSGGSIELIASTAVTLLPSALVDASGGFGGGLGTQPYANNPMAFENGARGGTGYFYAEGPQLTLGGTINAAVVAVPEPETYALMVLGLGVVLFASGSRRRKAAARRQEPATAA